MVFDVSLGMIVRNEGRTLEKCLESVAPYVKEIVIGLAGESTDNTEEIARRFTDKVFDIPWTDDFSEARNQVLEKVTGDYFMWLDGDDILIGGEHINRTLRQNPNVDGFYMGYDYARDEFGNNTCYLIRERIVRLQDQLPYRGWKWIGKVHEVLAPHGFQNTGMEVRDIVVQHHKPANKHEPDRNIKILYEQLAAGEPTPDPRVLAYLCTENMGRGNLKEAIIHAQRFVKVSGWDEERYQMQHRIADMRRALGEYDKALQADFAAISIQPDWPDAYLGLAETYAALNQYKAVIEWTKSAATKQAPQTMLIIDPLDYTFKPLIILAGAYAWLGDMEMALENYQKAYEIRPDQAVMTQMNLLQREINLRKVVDSFLTLREHLGRNDEWLKVRKLFDVVPKHVQQHPAIHDAWARTEAQTAHIYNPQLMSDYYTGNPGWYPSADSVIQDPNWLKYPRMKFAIDTAKRLGAKNVVDWGCSDGFISLPLAREGNLHVTGFDLDPRCVDLATDRAKRWGIDARFEIGNIDEIGGWEGDKADLAIAFEVIEHTVDPNEFLRKIELTAKHIALTTPYLSWDQGNLQEWDRVEPKGHLRIFDQYDLEAIITPRGRIWNLYRQSWGPTGSNGGWLFVDYEPGRRHDKNIIIGAMGSPEKWGPRKFEEGGLGGSETAIIKLSEGFVNAGHRPIVYTDIDEPGYYNGVCYRPPENFRKEIASDLFIAWRTPEYADLDLNTKCLVLWMHDTDSGDRITVERARKFDYIVVLSDWHKQNMMEKYPFLRPENTPNNRDVFVVLGNGVDFSRFEGKVKREDKRVIYSSSPDRGLDIILESVWPKVIEEVPDAELHIYYGWALFDKFAASYPYLAEFRAKINALLLNSKGVVQHGRVNQRDLAEAFQKSSIWLYPTYFSETYCITAIEAQLGGAIPITNRLAALNETVQSGINIVGDVHTPEAQQAYADAVIHVLNTPMKDRAKVHEKIRKAAPARSWDDIAKDWASFFLNHPEGELERGERAL